MQPLLEDVMGFMLNVQIQGVYLVPKQLVA